MIALPRKLFSLIPSLGVVFFLSGFSSLLYQVAWQRLMTVYYGVGTISMTLIVSIYMFGLGLGALLGGHYAERVKNHMILYFIVELGIGIFGVISFPALLFLGKWTAGSPYVLAGVYQMFFLAIPTILMGMTLPILTKIFNNRLDDFLKTVSVLYFLNTLGAAAGAFCGSYILISLWGLDVSIYTAAGINLLLAVFVVCLQKTAGNEKLLENISDPGESEKGKRPKARFLYRVSKVLQYKDPEERGIIPRSSESFKKFNDAKLMKRWIGIVFMTGFLAIGYEMIWFRVVGVLLKDSPYAFATILTIYLLGIALGSFGMGRWLAKFPSVDRRKLFFQLQALIALSVAGIFLTYYYLTLWTPFGELTRWSFAYPHHPPAQMLLFSPLINSFPIFLQVLFFTVDVFIWPIFFIIIPTIFMGASFPLIAELAYRQWEKNREASAISTVYFFNILGNVFGGFMTGFCLLPILGSERTLLVFILGGLLFVLGLREAGQKAEYRNKAVLVLGMILLFVYFPHKGQLYALMHSSPGKGFRSFFQEGVEGVVMTYQNGERVINFINGHSHGGRPAHSFYSQVIQASSVAASVEDVLIIGYGTGSITEAVLKMPEVKKVTLVELNRTLMDNLKKLELFQTLLSDPRLEIVFDDGRRYLLRQNKKFDMVFMSPLPTTTAYSNNLYSRQFAKLVLDHLKPQGILSMWTDEFSIMAKTLI